MFHAKSASVVPYLREHRHFHVPKGIGSHPWLKKESKAHGTHSLKKTRQHSCLKNSLKIDRTRLPFDEHLMNTCVSSDEHVRIMTVWFITNRFLDPHPCAAPSF